MFVNIKHQNNKIWQISNQDLCMLWIGIFATNVIKFKILWKISLIKLCQIMSHIMVCCCFCMTRIQNMIKWTRQNHASKITNLHEEVHFILKCVKKQHQQCFVCWYHWITKTWRYATIIKVQQYNWTVITVQELFTNESLEINIAQLLLNNYWCQFWD